MSQGLDNDHIDRTPDNAANPGSRFRPFATPIKASTWTVTTVKAHLTPAIRLQI